MTQFASDSFTGTSGTGLSTYNSSWVQHSSSSFVLVLTDANRVRREGAATSAVLYYHTASPGTADYSVSADLFMKETNGGLSFTGVSGRIDTSADTHYAARYSGGSIDGWQLYKFVAGTATQLGSTSTQSLTDETSYNVKLEMLGTAIKLYKQGSGSATISATDSAISSAGNAGIRFSGSTSETNATGIHLDNFSADTLYTSYTISPSGQISFSGTASNLRGYQFNNSGQISFSGTSPLSTDGVASYTFTVSGGITLSGTDALIKGKIFEPSGSLTLTGSNLFIKSKILSPSGQITFSGSANMFVPDVDGSNGTQTYMLRRYIGRR